MDAVSLRLLPWPALKITNLVVSEDPEFGAEPALLAPEVVAEPRLSSLWRGRFELSRVELDEASVNLVRAPSGRWNISPVLMQASHLQNAPTGQTRPGPQPRFPYIEAREARINFKQGVEKLPYSLLNADFSMFLMRPEVWKLKLQGQPDRTDLLLSAGDTGTLRLEGELHRAEAPGASSLHAMPLRMHGEWHHAPLGQLSQLLLGEDAGWRGEADAAADFSGTVDNLLLETQMTVSSLHRQEFAPEQPFSFEAHCRGTYRYASLQAARCDLPFGQGHLRLRQENDNESRDVTLAAEKLPVNAVAAFLGMLRPGVPAPGIFSGTIDGALTYNWAAHAVTGSLTSQAITITHAAPGDAPLVVTGTTLQAAGERTLHLSADALPLGLPDKPMLLSAEFVRSGYALHGRGSGSLPALEAAAAALRLPLSPALSGMEEAAPATAELALTAAGRWGEPPLAHASGSVQFSNVQWQAPWLPTAVRFESLHAAFTPGLVQWTTPGATVGAGADRAALVFAGDAEVPLRCDGDAPCITRYTLRTPALDTALLARALSGGEQPIFSALLHRLDPAHIALPALEGSLHAGTLLLGKLPVRDALLRMTTDAAAGPAVRIESLDGKALGGSFDLTGTMSFPSGRPTYALQTSLHGASAAQLSALWHESWGTGTLDAEARLLLAGRTAPELLEGARGSFRGQWRHGALPPALPRFESAEATGTVGSDGLTLEHGTIIGPVAGPATGTPASPPAALTGTMGWGRDLAVRIAAFGAEQPATVGGTLADPVLSVNGAAGTHP